jgi:curli biogenesis system outer membrane secretion channel CsgG
MWMAACLVAIATPAVGQGVTSPKQGRGGTVVQGGAGPGGSIGDNGLEHCGAPMGAMAVVEPQSFVLAALSQQRLGSPVGLIRLMIQQSNCFIVVERGTAMRNMMQERQLGAAGELRKDSNMGAGQMVSADFILTPSVVFSEDNAGGAGAALGGIIGRKAPAVGAIAGGVKFKEAQTSMLVSDARSGVQVAAAEGSTRKADLRLGGLLMGSRAGAALGGYGNTNEGKIIAAALMDNYNNVVRSVRNEPSLQRNVGTLRQETAAGGTTKAGDVLCEGDVLVPKIANVRVLEEPRDGARAIATLSRNEELVVIGLEKGGYINVQSATATGWVKVALLQKLR